MIIYKATNKINGKVYIGQTVQKLERRRDQHYSKAKTTCRTSRFINAIRKHGKENFSWEIIDRASCIHELNKKEIFYINNFESYNKDKGYNLELGGGNSIVSEETKKKLSISAKKRGISEESLKKMRKARKYVKGRSMPQSVREALRKANLGRVVSDEQKEKNRIASTGKTPSLETRKKLALVQQGEKGFWAKITENQAYEILYRLSKGERQADLAREYGMSDSGIYRLKTGKSWKHLKR